MGKTNLIEFNYIVNLIDKGHNMKDLSTKSQIKALFTFQ